MNSYKLILSALISLIFIPFIYAQRNAQVIQETNRTTLISLAQRWSSEHEINLAEARKKAEDRGLPLRKVYEDGTVIELQGISERGDLIYYKTGNLNAARTISTDKVWPGGGFSFSLSGDSMTAGEWDGGAVRASHQELSGRVNQADAASSVIDHATHVAGTIMASGVDTSAKGMAYTANLDAYDWNSDYIEMALAASNGMLVSNHSYGAITGWYDAGTHMEWWGDTTISGSEDYRFGFYDSRAEQWDQIARNAPYYLIIKSAGNDRGDSHSGSHYLPLHSAWSSTSRLDDGGTSGYDCISTYSGAKNILTVGAVNAIPGGYGSPSSVVMSSFSGWGPTDDGRIKPDLVANGVGVYSCLSTGNSAYASWNGTSMASPTVTGSLLLLQQHYFNTYGHYMKAATLKALAIHTADEAGSTAGPDYKFGWGLMNTRKAVQHISDTSGNKDIIEASIDNSQTFTFTFNASGSIPQRVTMCWTDIAGSPVSAALDPTTSMLVNDLDVRIMRNSDSTFYYPYILNPSSPSSAASMGDNVRDNVEQVYVASPSSGAYTVVVTHKGTLAGGSSQNFSIILNGGEASPPPIVCNSIVNAFPDKQDFESFTNCSSTSSAMCPLPALSGWMNDTLDDIDWKIYSGSTPSTNTGPTGDYDPGTSGGKFAYTEASTNGTGFPNKQAILYSPCYNLDTLKNAELAFGYHMYGADMGNLSVELFDGFGWIQIWSKNGDQGNTWHSAVVSLSSYEGDTIRLRFIGITGSDFHSDMAIDAIEVREGVPCPNPTNLTVYAISDTSAIFSWSSSASFWRLRFHLADSSLLLAATIPYNPVLIYGLSPSTSYDFYIQDSCGGGDTSEWVGPLNFTTTGPLGNPSMCGLDRPLPDDNCPDFEVFDVAVSTSIGTSMGNDVFLKEVNLILDHTYDADLLIALASPWKDTIALSAHNGGSGDNYGNPLDATCSQYTSFTMSASSAIGAGSAPFIGAYRPTDSLNYFNTGNSPNGTWKLLFCDNFSADSGNLQFIELVFDCYKPTVSISNFGSDDICAGNLTVLGAGSGDLYQWFRDGNAISGSTYDTLIVTQTGRYNVLVADSGGCADSASTARTVTVHNPPSVTISNSGLAAICSGSSTTLSVGGGSTYQWYKNGNTISSATSNSLVVNSAGNYNVVIGDAYGCSDSAASGYAITLNNLPNVSITNGGQSAFCTGSSTQLSTSGGSSYQWYKNGNSISSATSATYTVTASGRYNVVLTDGNGCSDSASPGLVITVYSLPSVSITNNGQASFCIGSGTQLSTSGGNAYQWYRNGQVISSATSSALNVITSGRYNVRVTDGNGCSDSAATGTSIIVYNLPAVNISAGGSPSFCDGDSVVLSTSGGSSYQWYLNGQPITSAVSVNYMATLSGNYNVEVTDVNGCSDSSSGGFAVTVFPLPAVSINAGTTSFCDGDSSLLSAGPATAYQWRIDGNLIPGANQQNYYAKISGKYNVVLVDVNQCSDSASSGVDIDVSDLPVVSLAPVPDLCNTSPAVTLSGNPPGGTYSGPGVSSGKFDPAAAGPGNHIIAYDYTDANSCSNSANQPALVKNCTGLEEHPMNNLIEIFPNPARSELFIRFISGEVTTLNVRMYSSAGQLVINREFVKANSGQQFRLDLHSLSEGIYFVHLQMNDQLWVQKVILE